MKRTFVALLVLFSVALIGSCGKESSGNPEAFRENPAAIAPQQVRLASAQEQAPSPGKPAADSMPERKITRTAALQLVVGDTAAVAEKLTERARAAGGYVADSRQWKDGDAVRAHLTIRVPAESLDAFLAGARGLAVDTRSASINAKDVTEEYVDVQAQLRNLQATEDELRELLTTVREKTGKASDVLEVHREMSRIRGEIDRLTGRLKYLDSAVALATVDIDLIPDTLAAPVATPGWRPIATIRDAARALVASLRWLADALIWLTIYLLPIGLVLCAPFVVIVRAVRRRRRARVAES